MSNTQTDTTDHAEANGRAWLVSIHEMVARLQAQSEMNVDDEDDAREAIQESVLSVGVRDSTFRAPGDNVCEPDEFEILLSTGGPALRIFGSLGRYNAPEDIELQKQDWGIPWTRMILNEEEQADLEKFVAEFYLGD